MAAEAGTGGLRRHERDAVARQGRRSTTPTISGRQVDDLDYYIILAKWKLAVVLEQGYQRRGDDEKLAGVRPDRARPHAGRGRPRRDHATTRREPVACAPRTCSSTVRRSRSSCEEVPDPVPGPGEVLVDIAYAAVNFPDVLIVANEYQVQAAGAVRARERVRGRVSAVGDGVDGVAVGDHVYGASFVGAYAEQIVVNATSVHRDRPTRSTCATPPRSASRTPPPIHTLRTIADVQQGETVLVLGAAGGVGLATVELATLMGGEVIAAASIAGEARAVREVRRGRRHRLHAPKTSRCGPRSSPAAAPTS